MSRPGCSSVTRAPHIAHRWSLRAVGCALLATLCVAVLGGAVAASGAAPAGPAAAPDRPPILMLGGGLGDSQQLVTHWLGDNVQEVASRGSLALLTSKTPLWWSSGTLDTYVLAPADGASTPSTQTYTVADLAWALDQLARRHPVGKAVLVCQGASGLMARAYLEDLGDPKESSRADVIGLVTLGTPHKGLSLLGSYPDLDVWAPYAAGGGLKAEDLRPDSTFMQRLNAGTLPAVVKFLAVRGACASLAGLSTDGVASLDEQVPSPAVVPSAPQTGVDAVDVRARASDVWSLRGTWFAKTKKGGATLTSVDSSEVENLDLVRGYATMTDVQAAVQTFYTTWFAGDVPTTHISSRLVVDVSGSMKDAVKGVTKLDAAKQACATFADVMAARAGVVDAVPEDLALVTFTTEAQVVIGPTHDPVAVKSAAAALKAAGNTDVGRAVEVAVNSFATAPPVAKKVVVLLSDGDTTRGMDDAAILAGPVAKAAAQGIRIDTIGLGALKEEDKTFLQKIASATNGSFSQALDAFELRRDFLRSRYESLGSLLVDSETALPAGKPVTVDVAQVGDDGRLIEIGLVPDGAITWKLLRDGQPVADAEVKHMTSADGALALSVEKPIAGSYTLELQPTSGTTGTKAQVFVVFQKDVFREKGAPALPSSSAGLWVIVIAAVGALAVILAIVFSLRRRPAKTDGQNGDDSAGLFNQPPS